MFGLGMGEIMIILVLALVLLGPARLPDAAKSIGKAMRDFRKATDDVKNQLDTVMYEPPKPPPAKPKLVDGPGAAIPPGGVPLPAGEVPTASQQNVPGLEAALAEPAPQPAFLKRVIAPAPPAAEIAAPAEVAAPAAVAAVATAAPAAVEEAPAAAEAQPKA
jgi:sec-independent protein translocase protein TatB